MRSASMVGVVLFVVLAGCTGNGKDDGGGDAAPPTTTVDPFPGVNETLFEVHAAVPQATLAPLGIIALGAIVDGDVSAFLFFDGDHFAVTASGAPHMFVRLYHVGSNETVALLRTGSEAAAAAQGLREIASFDPGEGLRLELRGYRVVMNDCEPVGPLGCGQSERGALVSAPPPLDVNLAPELAVTLEGPAAGADALDQLEFGTDGRPAPREAQNYTVTVEASRFLRGRLRFDFDASRIVSVQPVAVAQNYSTAFVQLDGSHRLLDVANLTVDQMAVRQTYQFRIDFENGTAHGPTGGSEQQVFRVEAYAWTPAGEGRVETSAKAELPVSVTLEVP